MLAGCGAELPEQAKVDRVPTHEPDQPVFEGELWQYVPAGGVDWVLMGKPRTLASNPELRTKLEPLLPASRLELYAKNTGLDLRNLPSALVAGFDLGTLYLAETDTDLTPATRAFSERLVNTPKLRQSHPRLQRVSGVVGQTPQALLRFDGKLLAVAVGDTTTVRIVEAFALGRLERTARVLDGAALRSFREFGQDAPLLLLAPGPFEGKWMYGVQGLLAAATGVGIAATPIGGAFVDVVVAIDGPWQNETNPPEAVARMRRAWEELSTSSTGQLFGLHEPAESPSLGSQGDRVELKVRLRLLPIIDGLRAAVAADVWEMLDLKASQELHGTDPQADDRARDTNGEFGPPLTKL